jgi:hypothetical protein
MGRFSRHRCISEQDRCQKMSATDAACHEGPTATPSASSPAESGAADQYGVVLSAGHEVAVLGVALDEGDHEGTSRMHRLVLGTDVVKGGFGEARSQPLSVEGRIDLGVYQGDALAGGSVRYETGQAPVIEYLIAVRLRVIDDVRIARARAGHEELLLAIDITPQVYRCAPPSDAAGDTAACNGAPSMAQCQFRMW